MDIGEITKEKVLLEIASVAFIPASDIRSRPDKVRCLDMLARHLGVFESTAVKPNDNLFEEIMKQLEYD